MNRIRIAVVLSLCLTTLSCAPAALASEVGARVKPSGSEGRLVESVERVAIFKDGYGLFTRKATAVVSADGTVYTTAIPEGAVLGSFWATAKNAELRSMRAEVFEESVREHHDELCVDTAELIRANPGREVVLHLAGGQAPGEVRGKLRGLLERPVDLGKERETGTVTHVPRSPQAGGHLVVIEQAEGERLVLPLSEVRRIGGKSLNTRCTIERSVHTSSKRLVFDLGKKAAGRRVTLSLMYFAPGIRWIPTYRLDLDGQTKGELALQAELLNEVEDLEGTLLDLVVGVPNFRFKTVASPLTLERALRDVLGRVAPGLMGQGGNLSNALFSQRGGERMTLAASGTANLGPDLPPDAPQDLEVYHLPPIHLAKGARMSVPLWQRGIDTKHVHTVDLKLDQVRRARGRSPLELSTNEVWHQLELLNPTRQAWTTGPVLVMRDGLPIAQELLTYTPPGRSTLLPLTIAVNLRTRIAEEETWREEKPERIDGRHWRRVKRHGTVEIDNGVGRPIELRLRLETEGKVISAAAGTIRHSDGSGPNNHSRVLWTVKLRPGKQRTLTFESEAFVG